MTALSGRVEQQVHRSPLGTAHFVHVHRTFCSYLPHILIMFTAQIVRTYRTFSSYIQHILIMFTAHFVRIYSTFTTFWQADSGGTRGRIAPAGLIKNNFSGGVAPIGGR